MGNDGLSKVVGTKIVSLETNKELMFILKEVRHVCDIYFHIISTSRLDDDGYCNIFNKGQWKITKDSLVVARGKKCSSLYLLQASIWNNLVNVVESNNMSQLWHKRLSHISENGLDCLAKTSLLPGLKDVKLDMCNNCVKAKKNLIQTWFFFKKRRGTWVGALKCMWSFEGKVDRWCTLNFIDDHSRKLRVRTLKTKDQVSIVFKECHVSIESETEKKLKCIHADNGGEYYWSFDA